jgi:CHRD domain-containing protein
MNVRKLMVMLVASAAVLGAIACSDDEGPTVERFTATLTGASEVPPVTTAATGTATVEFTATGLSWVVNVSNIANVTLAHIHGPAAVGVNAGVILNLNPNTTVTTGVLTSGAATTPTAATVSMDSLKTLIRAGLAYVNVHNQANGGGHIRGQLVKQ